MTGFCVVYVFFRKIARKGGKRLNFTEIFLQKHYTNLPRKTENMLFYKEI